MKGFAFADKQMFMAELLVLSKKELADKCEQLHQEVGRLLPEDKLHLLSKFHLATGLYHGTKIMEDD